MIPAPDGAPAQPTVKDEYDQAVALVQSGQYESAEKSLTVFLAKYSKTKYRAGGDLWARRELFPARAPSRSGREISGDLDQIPAVGAGAGRHVAAWGSRWRRSARANRPAPPSPRSASNIPARRRESGTPRSARAKSCNAERRAGAKRRCWRRSPREFALLLAVSGGPDSVALMLLAARWPQARGWRQDRGRDRRPWSASENPRDEALQVGRWAGALGFEHRLLSWEGPKPATRIQERARAARYALLLRLRARNRAGMRRRDRASRRRSGRNDSLSLDPRQRRRRACGHGERARRATA